MKVRPTQDNATLEKRPSREIPTAIERLVNTIDETETALNNLALRLGVITIQIPTEDPEGSASVLPRATTTVACSIHVQTDRITSLRDQLTALENNVQV